LLAGLHTRPPIDVGCTPGVDEGATRRVALHRGASQRTKAGRGKRDVADDHSSTGDPARDPPSRCEDSRVRECDLIMRCVASPPRCPSDRHRPSRLPVQPRAKASGRSDLKGFTRLPNGSSSRDAKGEGTPGRGSSVSFTRCEVNRSWLEGSRVFFTSAREAGERQGGQTWLAPLSMTRREDNARSEREPRPPKRATAS
jgi:hypothetical protein